MLNKSEPKKALPHQYGLRTIMDLFDVGYTAALITLSTAAVVLCAAIIYFVHSAPPTTITISSGPEGSGFQKSAQKYADLLKKEGIKVKVLTSNGSLENLQRLSDPKSHVDLGIVQAGTNTPKMDNLVSLGSISYQPLLVFYRGAPLDLLSKLEGKKVAIGPVGSGARNLALSVLAANGIKEGGKTELLDWDAEEAAKALTDHKIDAAFVMSESAAMTILHDLLRSKDIHLYSFKQANAYNRKIDHMNILDLPEGGIDIGLDIPSHDITLVGPMVELVATKNLHPALSDLILEAATTVHSKPGIFQHRGEFPAPIEHELHVSDDANRYYKSGKSFFYRILPFWLASLTSRILVVFLPTLVILIPVLRMIPAFFRWRTQLKLRSRYRELLALERDYLHERDVAKRDHIRQRFDHIEAAVNRMKVKAAFADQFYGLRGHIDYVRQHVMKA